MAQFTKTIPKHPTDCNKTLDAVLDNIKFNNENDTKLMAYSTGDPEEVVLTYDG